MLYGEHYIDVFSQGRNESEPLLTLYDDEGIKLFFHLLTVAPTIARAGFKEGMIALVSFHVSQDLQTGTARYDLSLDGKLRIVSETGILSGLLERIGVTESSKPYTCSICEKPLSFPDAFFYEKFVYCSEHLPHYDKETEGW